MQRALLGVGESRIPAGITIDFFAREVMASTASAIDGSPSGKLRSGFEISEVLTMAASAYVLTLTASSMR